MEEELGGCEAGQVGILHKATTLGPIVILDEMGQSPVLEPKWDPLALHILLPDNSNDLRDVDLGTFSPRHNHRLKVVVFRQGFLGRGASLVSGIIENAVHLVLKRLPQSVPWGGL